MPPLFFALDDGSRGVDDNFANLQGAVEDVSVYDRALTVEEITAHFAAMGTDKRQERPR